MNNLFGFAECDEKDKDGKLTGKTYRRPWSTTVFHISQTEVWQ